MKNKKSTILFPGQGVPARQVIEYYNHLKLKNPKKTKRYLHILNESLTEINQHKKININNILADDTNPAWNLTDFVQPVTYTLSMLTFELMSDKSADYVTGHSLGALSALTASGAIDFPTGCRIAAARGKFMQEESANQNTGMIAVIGLEIEKIKEICKSTQSVIALMNAPTVFTIGCDRKSFPKIEEESIQKGARKTIILPNSGAFHTNYMQGGFVKFNNFIKNLKLKEANIPVVINMKGTAVTDPKELKDDLIDSMINPVNWIRTMEFLKSKNVQSVIESGPGNTLSILARMNGIERENIKHAKEIL